MAGILSAVNKSEYGDRKTQKQLAETVTSQLHEARDKLQQRIDELRERHRAVPIRAERPK